MFQQPAIVRNPRRQQQAVTSSLPAPVGGWNDRDALGDMDPKFAVIMDNFFPQPAKVIIRKGSTEWATGLTSAVETLMGYKPSTGTAALFAGAGAYIYNVTLTGAVVTNYSSFPGASGDYIHSPDSAAVSVTGDLDLRAYIAATDWTPTGVQTIISKSTDSGDQRSYRLFLDTTGKLGLLTSVDGTATISTLSTVAPTIANGVGLWVRATVDVDDGAVGNAVSFYTATASDTPPTSWTQLGTTVTNAGTTAIFDSTALLELGSHTAGTLLRFIGKIWQTLVYSGIGGVLKAHFNANDGVPGDTSITSSVTAEVYTVAGAVTVVGPRVVDGLTNARWQHINIATSGGNFLMAVNGADKLRGWDGTNWWADGDGAHDITGVDTATCISVEIFKRRVWLIENNSTSVWYLPVDSIAGAAAEIDLGPLFSRGGKLMAMADWSLDAGIGIDDYAAFISDQGEVAIYKGSDPSSATTWALVGVFLVGAPIGRRCTAPLAGDVMLICRDGLIPLSKALMSSRVNTSVALTDNILNTMSASVALYATTYGWQVIQFAAEGMVVMNVPVGTGQQQQYVMNTITGAWCRFKGWPANCFEVFGEELYFGGAGKVYKAWTTQADVSANISGEVLQAFSYFGNRGGLKEWTLARPLIAVNAGAGLLFGLNTDFDTTAPTGILTVNQSSAGQWGVAQWGTGKWGGDPVVQKNWASVLGVGYCAAIHIKSATMTGKIEWSATDFAMKRGGVL